MVYFTDKVLGVLDDGGPSSIFWPLFAHAPICLIPS